MALSTNSIFHFTSEVSNLIGLLNGNFNVSYCLEEFRLNGFRYSIGIPMVSFCDIPLSQVGSHVNSYGNFGIGLNKEWAKLNKINPVLYIQHNSVSAKLFEPFLRHTIDNDEFKDIGVRIYMDESSSQGEVILHNVFTGERQIKIQAIQGLLAFIKNYDGELRRKEEVINPNYRFYDEREWRYVPEEYIEQKDENGEAVLEDTNIKILITKEEYIKWRGKENNKPILHNGQLNFEPKDIDYIIVEKDSQISDLIESISENSTFYNTKEELNLMISKIISAEKIRSDF